MDAGYLTLPVGQDVLSEGGPNATSEALKLFTAAANLAGRCRPYMHLRVERAGETRELARLFGEVRKSRVEFLWVRYPADLSGDESELTALLHEFRRYGCKVYDASQMRVAELYARQWPDEAVELARKAMCLNLDAHPVLEAAEWVRGLGKGVQRKRGRSRFEGETLTRLADLGQQGLKLEEIADALNGEGRTTQTGRRFTPQNVGYYLASRR